MNAQLQFFFLMVAGWVNRQQQAIIEYLQTENKILLEQLGGKPKRFTDAQRMRLARKAKVVGRRRLRTLSTMVNKLEREHKKVSVDLPRPYSAPCRANLL